MSTIATTAQTADSIDYWIRRYAIQCCYGTHPSQRQTKFNSARDRRVGLLAIGQCLKDQYDALATPMPWHLAALVKRERYRLRVVRVSHRRKALREGLVIQWDRQRPVPPHARSLVRTVVGCRRRDNIHRN
jgi:hypothetical protein